MTKPDNRRPMSQSIRALAILALCAGLIAPVTAATVYVIDKLLVGLHESKDLDSAIVKVLPTGTVLEVLERDGELALVAEPDGVKGWVDAAYLMDTPPAATRVAELEKTNAELERRLKQPVPAATAAGAAPADNPQIDALTKENTDLKDKLSDEKLRTGTLQSEIASLRAQVKTTAQPPDVRLVELERSRDELERDLENARHKIAEFEARASQDDIAALVPIVLREYAKSIAIIVILLAVVAFVGGAYLVDWLNRRRHGGFRI